VVIVGAGVSGLCCALELQQRGVKFLLLEADEAIGGRVRTDRVDGFLLDRGFQVLLTAYPEVQSSLDLDALRLGRFAPGAMVRSDGRFAKLANPIRRPGDAWSTLTSGIATPLDGLRIARLWLRLGRGDPMRLLSEDAQDTLSALRAAGFSARLVESFFRPFLGGVLLDRELRASSRAFEFLFRMFAEGDAALPAEGMGAIPHQLAARLSPPTLRMRVRVARLEDSGVVLQSGERINAAATVIATSAPVASKLLPGLQVPGMNPATCLHFDAPESPPVGDFLLLDGDGTGPINELCVPSAVSPSYAPPGRSLVSASVIGAALRQDDELEAAAREQLCSWFGPSVESWRLLRVDRISDALPAQPPGALEPAQRNPQIAPKLFVCGDYRDLASLQGAMASGRRAARAVSESLG
jgi:phytoene dehydrogenase-like protein